jgi:hypothetical protein
VSWLQSWRHPGQNRESGGRESEQTPYATGDAIDPNPATEAPDAGEQSP